MAGFLRDAEDREKWRAYILEHLLGDVEEPRGQAEIILFGLRFLALDLVGHGGSRCLRGP